MVVGTGADYQARRLMDRGMPFTLLVDPEANVYRALGIGRTRWRDVLRPEVIRNYLGAFRRGGRQGRVTGDPLRLSGVAVLDGDARVRWAHVARVVGDYPSVEEVLDALRALTP